MTSKTNIANDIEAALNWGLLSGKVDAKSMEKIATGDLDSMLIDSLIETSAHRFVKNIIDLYVARAKKDDDEIVTWNNVIDLIIDHLEWEVKGLTSYTRSTSYTKQIINGVRLEYLFRSIANLNSVREHFLKQGTITES